MIHFVKKMRGHFFYRFISAFIAFSFAITTVLPPSYAQSLHAGQAGINVLNLPIPGTMVTPTPAFVPVLLKGMTIYPEDPLRFDFIIDSGNTTFTPDEIKKESERLVKYFLASMTIPKNDLWVNLSPYEEDRIIPEELGRTELGRDMLAQDYILKQLTASLMYPEEELGKKFWDKIYAQAQAKFGTSEIPMNTFNKVWILPESATVYENGRTVYVVQSRLKVMLDEDYLALDKNKENKKIGTDQISDDQYKDSSSISSQIVREIILPEIEREVNEGKNFVLLRQIYHSLILSKWYKGTIKESLLSKVYVDQKKMTGVELDDKTIKDRIYDQYMEAYKKGVFNFIKEDYDQLSQEVIPRKYFSGGEEFDEIPLKKTKDEGGLASSPVGDNYRLTMRVVPHKRESDQAMLSDGNRIPVILLTGMPGSGKGTVGSELALKLGMPHISLGEMLRKMWDEDPSIPRTPELGADKLIEHLQRNPLNYANGIVLDSNPISLESQRMLEGTLRAEGFYITKVVNVETRRDVAEKRFVNRPPRGGDERYDRLEDRFTHRMELYDAVTVPLLNAYEQEKKVINFDNNGTLDDMLKKIAAITPELNLARVMETVKNEAWDEDEVREVYIPLVEELVRLRESHPERRVTIGISGVGSSGKTSLAKLLNIITRTLMGYSHSSILNQDDFFMTREEIQKTGVNEWTPEAVNIDEVSRQMDLFKKQGVVTHPVLRKINPGSPSQDFERVGEDTSQAEGILFVEGIDIFNRNSPQHEKLYRKIDVKIYIAAEGSLAKAWWIERESQKYPTQNRAEHEQKWKERIDRKNKSDGSLTLAERQGLWISADVVIDKERDHGLKLLYYRSPYGKGSSITQIGKVTINPISAVGKTIENLKEYISNLSDEEKSKASRVLNKLKEVHRNLGIGWIDVLAKNEGDYVIGFADPSRQQIGLVPEFFKAGGIFSEDLERAVFYFGYQLVFPNDFHAVDWDYMNLHKHLFGSAEIISKNKIDEFVRFSSKPKEVPYNAMSEDQMQRLDLQERKGSLALAKQIAERIRSDNGGKMPTVAFLTPTGKGGGVSVLVKDIAEVLFSQEIGINGQWISAVRHENIDYWGASGRFQQALMGTADDVSPENLERLTKAMADNIEAMDLEGVDYIFMHEPYTLGMTPLIRRKYPHIKIIWFMHGDLSTAKPTGRRLLREYLSEANAAIFSWMEEYIPKGEIGAPTVFMIHGINQENTKNIPLNDDFINAVAQKYGIDRNRPLLLHVGRYNLTKDPLRSIAAYLKLKDKLKQQGDRLPQLIISGIPLAPSDWKLYKDLIKFVATLSDPDIHVIAADNVATEYTEEQIRALENNGLNTDELDSWDKSDLELNALQRLATVGIHPASNEGFGLVISEALIKGTPVVASNLGGIPMQIKDSRFLVDLPEDPFEGVSARYDHLKSSDDHFSILLSLMDNDSIAEAFAERIQFALNMDDTERTVMLDNSRRFISSEYSIFRSMMGHLELIEVLGLIERIQKNYNDENAIDRLSKANKKFIPVIARHIRESSSPVQDRLIKVLKMMGDARLTSLLDDIQYLKSDDGTDFDSLYERMKKMARTYSRDYLPIIIRRLDESDKNIQRNFATLLSIMGEDIAPDLIKTLETNQEHPFLKRGIITVLREIGVMGNKSIRALFQKYLRTNGISTDEKAISSAGLSYDENLGKLAESVASLSHIKSGENIAGELVANGIYPTEELVASIAIGQNQVGDIINRFQSIRENNDFNKDNPIDLSLGYSLLRADAENQNLKLDLTYEDYLLWIKGEKDFPVYGGAPSIEQKHLDELYYLAKEAFNLEREIIKAAERARSLNRPLVVIGNNVYGGQIALAPIADSLKAQDIRVIYARVPSGNAHLNPYYVPHDIFNEQGLGFMLKEKPIIFIVDGTNSMRGTVLEGLKRRFRQPHYPDSYLGFRNYFLALNDVLGQTTDIRDFHISREMYEKLRQSQQFRRLVEHLKGLKIRYDDRKRESQKGSNQYKFSFWSASKRQLPIRVERVAVKVPSQRDVRKVAGPEIIFAQPVMEDIKSRVNGISTHIPGYFDISLFESGYRNFDFRLYQDSSGPHLRSIRQENLDSVKSQMTKVRLESLKSTGQDVLDYFSKAKATAESYQDPGAILLLGNHEIKTALSFINYYRQLQISGKEPPIVISGGEGRGTHFLRRRIKEHFDALNENLPDNFMDMSEAQLNRLLLMRYGIPEDKIHLEEKASNSFENLVFSKPIFEKLIRGGLISPNSSLAIFQTPTQTLRAQNIAEDILKGEIFSEVNTIVPYSLRLTDVDEEEMVITLFRLVGLRSLHIEGEIPIFDKFNKDAAATFTDQIRRDFQEIEQEFGLFMTSNPHLFEYIKGFFSSTYLSKGDVDALIEKGGDEIRRFLQELVPYVDAPKSSPYGDIADIDNLWGAVDEFRNNPENFTNDALLERDGNNIPRIEVRGKEDSESGGVAQVAIIGIPGHYRENRVNRLRGIATQAKLSIRMGGFMTLEANIDGVNKALAIDYVSENFNDLLNKIDYTPGHSIDATKTKTVIFADGDGTTYGKPTAEETPDLFGSEAHAALLNYLKAGGVYVLLSGNDIELTKKRLLKNNAIPIELRHRVIVIANGGATLMYFNQDGEAKELNGYKYAALIKKKEGKVRNLDAIYLGDDVDPFGNDYPVLSKLVDERFISVSPKRFDKIERKLQNSHVGFNQVGVKAVLEAVVEYAGKNRFKKIFSKERSNLSPNNPNSLINLARSKVDRIKVVVLDLDGTLAEYNQNITEEVIEPLIRLIKGNKKVVIVTDDIESKVNERVRPLVEAIPTEYRKNLFVFTDSATNGFSFQADGTKHELTAYNVNDEIGPWLREKGMSVITENFSDRVSFDDRESRLSPRFRFDLRANNPDDLQNIVADLQTAFDALGIPVKVYKAGHVSIKIVRKHKEHAIADFMRDHNIDESSVLILADSGGEGGIDRKLLTKFSRSISVNVGKYSDFLPVDNPNVIKYKDKDVGVQETKKILNELAKKHEPPIVDNAMLSSSPINSVQTEDVGGIDLNNIEVERQGAGVNVHFDPAAIQPILDSGIDGFVPVIINLMPINSIMPLLGLEPRNKEEEYEISVLN